MDHHDHSSMMNTTADMMMGNTSMGGHDGHMGHNDPHSGHIMGGSTTMDGGHHHHHTTQDPHSGHNMGGQDHGSGHMMKMYFHTGLTEYILFESLHTSNVGGLVGACVAMFVLSFMYEGLKYLREFLLRKAAQSARQEAYTPSDTSNGGVITKQPEIGARMLSGSHAVQTLLHMVQVFLSYCLMLVFMTYNVYLCIAVILGAGFGYFFFGWRRAMVVDMNEHCH